MAPDIRSALRGLENWASQPDKNIYRNDDDDNDDNDNVNNDHNHGVIMVMIKRNYW